MMRRFDRLDQRKHHAQSLRALAHLDFNQIGTHSYEQLFMVAAQLVAQHALQQLFMWMCFNIVACNCDDHTKEFAFRL
jgi:serine/threonine-protein kinase HipA